MHQPLCWDQLFHPFFWALNLWRNLLPQGWLFLSFVLAGENWDSNILLRASYAGNEVVAVGRGPAVSRCGLGELRRLWVQPWGRRNSSQVVKQFPRELVCAEEGGKKWMQVLESRKPLVLQWWAMPQYWGRNCGKQLMMSWEKRELGNLSCSFNVSRLYLRVGDTSCNHNLNLDFKHLCTLTELFPGHSPARMLSSLLVMSPLRPFL